MSKEYRAKVKTYGFQGKMWEPGETVVVQDDQVMNRHFEFVRDVNVAAGPVVQKEDIMKPIPNVLGVPIVKNAVSGFAKGLDIPKQKEMNKDDIKLDVAKSKPVARRRRSNK